MKIALAVPRLTKDINANILQMKNMISDAQGNGAGLVLFPEAALTGLVNTDIYEKDIQLARPVRHEHIAGFGKTAQEKKIWLCFGFLENEDGCIFDSALLFNPEGEIILHYRRINPCWRAGDLPPGRYSEGAEIPYAATPLGKTAIIICGDLFDENVLSMLNKGRPDFILFPFARCFPSAVADAQKEWDETEKFEYMKQARLTGAAVAMANYIGTPEINDASFGGAFVIDKKGGLAASLPLLQEGMLFCEIEETVGSI
jgi:N-carbamoylputrescine amidase